MTTRVVSVPTVTGGQLNHSVTAVTTYVVSVPTVTGGQLNHSVTAVTTYVVSVPTYVVTAVTEWLS